MKTNHSGRRCEQSKFTQQGLTLWETIVVIVVLAVLIALFLPALMPPRLVSTIGVTCINNLKQIGLSFRVWAADHNGKFPMQVSVNSGGTMELTDSGVVYPHFQVMSNELNTPVLTVCPGDSRAAAALDLARGSNAVSFDRFPTNFRVRYFVGVDAQPERPKMFLSGDANLTASGKSAKPGLLSLWTNSPVAWAKPLRPCHGERRNILTVDGSVHRLGDASLHKLLYETSVATNRLAMP